MSLSALEFCRIARTARRLFCFGRCKCHRPPCARCSKARMASPRSCGCIRMHSLFGCHLPRLPSHTFDTFCLLSVAFSTLTVSFSNNSDCLQRNFWVGPRAIVIATFVWHPERLRQSLSNDLWHLVTSCDNWGPLQIWSSHQNVESQDCRKNPPTTLHRYHDHLALSTFLFWDQPNGRMDGSERFSKSATYNTYWTLKLKKKTIFFVTSLRSFLTLRPISASRKGIHVFLANPNSIVKFHLQQLIAKGLHHLKSANKGERRRKKCFLFCIKHQFLENWKMLKNSQSFKMMRSMVEKWIPAPHPRVTRTDSSPRLLDEACTQVALKGP